ncbi:MAG: lamin tail domain-containing protein [Deltaproteobacteria bacterium]|nr:lamin tail domain-containing protein [Deltaproteobacteria bacterium]
MRRLLVAALVFAAACGSGSKKKPDAGGDAPGDSGTVETVCRMLPTTSTTCAVTAGSTTLLLEGNVVTPGMVFKGGQVAVDASGKISCVGCDCAAGGETVIACADATISPGLINTHDHITYTQDDPYTDTGERYEDRQQWRIGLDGHTKIPSKGSATADQVSWGELRFLMGGATSTVGSGGQAGLLRNLDKATLLEGLTDKAVKFDTFPLGDSSGTRRTGDCNYGSTGTTAASLASVDSYEPHTSEGIDATARNEFLCESSDTYDAAAPGVSQDLAISKTAMIHAIGLTVDDYALMAASSTGLIWSPRSNITLYGDTARVTEAARLGVRIALGTDWMPSGSMNMLRELRCADSFNQTYLGKFFSDEQLWRMVTANAAAVTATDDSIGTLAMGKVADISIFAAHGKDPFRAVLDAEPQDVALVMRGGKVLYGDDNAVGVLAQGCDAIPDVCGTPKQVCLMSEIGKTYAALQTANAGIYPAFACGQPMNEPSCTPKRPASVAGSTVYTGVPGTGDMDGDGVPDASDNCPMVFNPVRPMDNGMQGDADADGVGDACDPCPRDANQTNCTAFDPNDKDSDGVPNSTDNCPDVANPSQTDSDSDGKGDACDACPNTANPGAQGCPATIYQVKMGSVPLHEAVEITNALVTAKGATGFFVQTKPGDAGYTSSDYSGLFVFLGTGSPLLANAVVGTRVTLDGTVDQFQGETELDNVATVNQTTMTAEPLPPAIPATYAEVTTGGTRAATLEGVLVALGSSQTTAVNMLEFTVTDANSSNLIISNFLFQHPNPAVGETFTAVTGVLATKGNMSRLEPRSATDLVAGPPVLSAITPGTSFVRAGAAAGPSFPTALTVSLSGPAQGDTFVSVSSNNASLVVSGGGVTIPNGQTSAPLTLTATAQVLDVTLTATYQTGTATAHVRALGATEAPTTVTLPATLTVGAGATKPVTVTLDIPAPPGGTTVNLAASAGTIAANVVVPANAQSANVNYTAPASGSTATITATLGGSTSQTAVTIGVDHLVINEIDYDNVGTGDSAEFIEIYNPSGVDVDLSGLAVILVNGANNASYQTIDLSSAGTLASHGYLVIAGTNVTAGNKLDPGWGSGTDKIQNGAPDGLALVDTAALTVIDALSYEGPITAAVLPNFPAPVSLVEGTVLPTAVADSNTTDGSLCRDAMGTDTDNAASDWHFCATKTPGAANP